mmetsp:Transcript_86322/g.278784  ORF Transcript_86322/g.278784 Transcript_86322/m.278784 type:complete len:248 (+) Transcript_86322:1850-2593(+)
MEECSAGGHRLGTLHHASLASGLAAREHVTGLFRTWKDHRELRRHACFGAGGGDVATCRICRGALLKPYIYSALGRGFSAEMRLLCLREGVRTVAGLGVHPRGGSHLGAVRGPGHQFYRSRRGAAELRGDTGGANRRLCRRDASPRRPRSGAGVACRLPGRSRPWVTGDVHPGSPSRLRRSTAWDVCSRSPFSRASRTNCWQRFAQECCRLACDGIRTASCRSRVSALELLLERAHLKSLCGRRSIL